MWKKSKENLQKRRFPVYFSKIGLDHVLSIANARLYEKKSEKTYEEISRKCQKNGFSGIFPAFSAGKICFLKIGLSQILDIAILHLRAKFHEIILSTAQEIQEIPFFRRKSAVPAIFDSSGFKNQFY